MKSYLYLLLLFLCTSCIDNKKAEPINQEPIDSLYRQRYALLPRWNYDNAPAEITEKTSLMEVIDSTFFQLVGDTLVINGELRYLVDRVRESERVFLKRCLSEVQAEDKDRIRSYVNEDGMATHLKIRKDLDPDKSFTFKLQLERYGLEYSPKEVTMLYNKQFPIRFVDTEYLGDTIPLPIWWKGTERSENIIPYYIYDLSFTPRINQTLLFGNYYADGYVLLQKSPKGYICLVLASKASEEETEDTTTEKNPDSFILYSVLNDEVVTRLEIPYQRSMLKIYKDEQERLNIRYTIDDLEEKESPKQLDSLVYVQVNEVNYTLDNVGKLELMRDSILWVAEKDLMRVPAKVLPDTIALSKKEEEKKVADKKAPTTKANPKKTDKKKKK